jgi:periodic tryptophan protein 2
VAFNATGDWIAFGSSKFGQLLVWEWQSESYILKQQGHAHDMPCLSYSPDGQFIATGGDDGKVKLWNTSSGFCFVTFTEHSAGITGIAFPHGKQVAFTSSLDGTVRAFDLIRYRNFRTFTSPSPAQFSSLAVDPKGELVCAGSSDTFEIFVWSVQTGQLLDILSGHEGPVSCLAFSPIDGRLASGSWDGNVKLWDLFSRDRTVETLEQGSEVLTLAFRPTQNQLATTTLHGQILFWDVEQAQQIGSIDGTRDLGSSRLTNDKITADAATSSRGRKFTSLCFTADGSGLLAGGDSKFVCIYDVNSKHLLKKFQTSNNLSLDGMHAELDSRNMTEAGPKDLLDDQGDASDLEDRMDISLPGVKSGDLSLRKTRPVARTTCVRFSPTGRSWAAATTEGLLVYSLDSSILFDPFDLELDITPDTIQESLENKEYLKALVMSFRLGELEYTQNVYNAIPSQDIELCVRDLPTKYLNRFLQFLASHLESSPRLEFHLKWCLQLLQVHGRVLKEKKGEMGTVLRGLQKALQRLLDDLSKV